MREPPSKREEDSLMDENESLSHSNGSANFVGQQFWARGYFVSTVGRDEMMIREYIRHQEQEDERIEQMNLWQ